MNGVLNDLQPGWQSTIVTLAIVVALTALAILDKVSGDVVVPILGTLAAGHAILTSKGKADG